MAANQGRIRAIRTSVAAALVVMTSAAGVTAAVHASAPAPCGGNTAYAGNGWQAIKVPQLSTIALATSVTYAPDRIYASDGHSTLVRSDSGGCSWADISPTAPTLGDTGTVTEAVTIAAISAPSSSTSAAYIYIGANITPTDQLPVSLPAQPVVYASPTGGPPYAVANSSHNGLPAVGTITDIAASDLTPRTVYTIISNAGSNSGLWASTDGANSWNGPYSPDTTLTHLRVDPTVSNHLYALKPGTGVVVSTDGGRSFEPINRTTPDDQSFAATSGSGSLQLAEGHSSNGVVDLTLDAARSWRTVLFTGLKARTVAMTPVTPILVAYDDQHLTLADVRREGVTYRPLTPGVGTPRDDTVSMTAPTAEGSAITGIARDNLHLLRTVYNSTTRKIVAPTLTPIHLLPQVTVKQFPSVLTGDTARVALPAGGTRDVNYRLLLPRTPSPVDLMFVVDTTDSTDQMIDGVRQGLQTVVNELQSTGLDTQFGLADFKDYPYWAGGGGDDHDYPYKLRRKIGPANLTLQTALGALRAADGGDVPESDLAALYYSTTGNGEKFGRRTLVAPGGDAGYRADALRLAVLATDEQFHSEPDYPGPSWGRTVGALNAAGVHQIGLAVESTDSAGKPKPGTFNSLHDQQRMARATDALAPRGGVDCDGDGVTDIDAGGPLVCSISKQADSRIAVPLPGGGSKIVVGSPPPPVHLAPLIVQLAENIPDLRPVTLAVSGAPTGVARTVSPSPAPTVNIRADNTLGYVIRYTCPKSGQAHTWPLTVTARAGARAVTSTHTTLACGPVAPIAAPAVALTLTAGIAPAAPPNPPTNVNANFNPNPAVNPNAGFAQQDEEQPQLALAESDQGLEDAQENTSLAMSRRTTDSHAALMLGAAALMTAGAAGYATRRRWRTASQGW